MNDRKQIFDTIYSSGKWGIIDHSGPGSLINNSLDGGWRHINLLLKPFYKKYKIIKKYEVENYKKAVYLYVSK